MSRTSSDITLLFFFSFGHEGRHALVTASAVGAAEVCEGD